MEYYSVIKKKEIATTWMDLEGMMLREKHQRKTNTVRSHLYVEYKNKENKKPSS